MNENILDLIDLMLDTEKKALNAAVNAIYFKDNSDYLTALWEVTTSLLEDKVPEDAGDEFIGELYKVLNPQEGENEQ